MAVRKAPRSRAQLSWLLTVYRETSLALGLAAKESPEMWAWPRKVSDLVPELENQTSFLPLPWLGEVVGLCHCSPTPAKPMTALT